MKAHYLQFTLHAPRRIEKGGRWGLHSWPRLASMLAWRF